MRSLFCLCGGESPLPSRAVVLWVRKSRAMRQCGEDSRGRVLPAARRGECPPDRGWALTVTYSRATRQCRKQNQRRVIPPREGPGYRRGKSRCGVNRNIVACNAGGESPLPSRAVVLWVTKSRATRQCREENLGRVLLTAGPPPSGGGYRAVVSIAT